MFEWLEEVRPLNVVVRIALTGVLVYALVVALHANLAGLSGLCILALLFRTMDTALMIMGMAWNHANTGTVWDKNND